MVIKMIAERSETMDVGRGLVFSLHMQEVWKKEIEEAIAKVSLTAGLDTAFVIESRDEFDLKRYETHVQAHIQDFPVCLDEIPPLSKESSRKDRIWRFAALENYNRNYN